MTPTCVSYGLSSHHHHPLPPSPFLPALKPVLKPPKLAPSAWQLYFTDWIQRQQASGTKLNVAQAAKEAGHEYASLSPQDKEVTLLFLLLLLLLLIPRP